MIRPLLLSISPEAIAGRIYYRFYRPVPEKFRPLYQKARLRYAPGMTMTLPKTKEYMYDCIALMGVYESDLTRRVRALACRGGLMVDVGANVGYFTLVWLAHNPTNRVIALEPAPLVIPYLRENIRINRVGDRGRVVNCAAGAIAGVARFSSVSDDATGWGRFAAEAEKTGISEVATTPLDDIVPSDDRVKFLKIDVEGAEAMVLDGAEELLGSHRVDHVYVEVNKPGARALGLPETRALEVLRRAGYKLVRLDRRTKRSIENWWASAPDVVSLSRDG